MLDICGGEAIYAPINTCGECSAFESRIKELESKVSTLESGQTAQETLNTQFNEAIETNTSDIGTINTKIGNKADVVISKTDAAGTVSVTVLGSV